jgi:hypothetical protein
MRLCSLFNYWIDDNALVEEILFETITTSLHKLPLLQRWLKNPIRQYAPVSV